MSEPDLVVPTRGRAVRLWQEQRALVVAMVLVLLTVAAVAAVGGFARVPPYGRDVQSGERIDVGRFAITVDRAELSNTTDPTSSTVRRGRPPQIRVYARVENLSRASVTLNEFDSLFIVLPDGSGQQDDLQTADSLSSTGSNIDPGLPVDIVYERDWPGAPAALDASSTVRVVVRQDETVSSLIFADRVRAGSGAGTATLPLTDARLAEDS